jgi:hypothetical protein
MTTRSKSRFRPQIDGLEERRLMSLAVLEVLNESKYNVGFDFRWTPNSAWTAYTEAPGQGEIFSAAYSSSLTPQALFNPTTSAGNETTVALSQGYNQWNGTGTPPASAAKLYEFENTSTGVGLFYVAPPSTQTDAVLSIGNSSSYTITFDFRWTPSSQWTAYTEGPGQSETFSTTYSSSLTPQVLYNPTTHAGVQETVSLAQGYGEWTGTGTPPATAAQPYGFENTPTGPELFYLGGSTAPAPNPSAVLNGNWSGYVAAPNLSQPQLNTVTAVSGSWIVPTVTGPSTGTTDSAVWVGIDGYGNGTVEQVGTSENVINGKVQYYAWWEMYSTGKQQPGQPLSMMIEPGDSISASVQYISTGVHAGQYYMQIVDNSRSNDSAGVYATSAQYQSPSADRSCAEWIVEAPTIPGSGIAALADFSPVTFTNASATINGVSGPINSSKWQSTAEDIGTSTDLQDVTSVLLNSGTSFVVTYNASTATGAVARAASQNGVQANTIFGATKTSEVKHVNRTESLAAWKGASPNARFRMPVQRIRRIADFSVKDDRRD